MRKLTCGLLSLSLLLCACQSAPVKTVKTWIKPASTEHTFSANNPALAPVARPDEWWVKRQAAKLEEVKAHPGTQLIFIGDSITHGWEGAPDLWTAYFGAYDPINLGFSGDQTQHVLWRIEHGTLDGISPKVAVVMIGTNNSNANDYTAEQIGEGVTAIVDQLRARLPKTKILLLGIFPRGEKPDAQRAKNAQATEIFSKLADNKHVFFLDIGQGFLAPDGTLNKEIMPDYLHPNWVGYKIWGISMQDKLAELEK